MSKTAMEQAPSPLAGFQCSEQRQQLLVRGLRPARIGLVLPDQQGLSIIFRDALLEPALESLRPRRRRLATAKVAQILNRCGTAGMSALGYISRSGTQAPWSRLARD